MGAESDPDARTYHDVVSCDCERRLQQVYELVGHADSGGTIRVRQHHRELVAAQAGEGVRRAQFGVQAGSDLLQDQVASLVTERVVDLVEAVQVEQQEAHPAAGPPRGANRLLQAVEQQGAVGQTGERVTQGVMDKGGLSLFACGDVQSHPDQAFRAPGWIPDHTALGRQPAHFSTRVADAELGRSAVLIYPEPRPSTAGWHRAR